MKLSVLCTDNGHPVVPVLRIWQASMRAKNHEVELTTEASQLSGGDILFLVSCEQLLKPAERARYRSTLVLHASDLPRGRGWSPHVWAILDRAREITVCLLEAADSADAGAVWLRRRFTLDGHELLPEINAKLFDAEMSLMSEAVECFTRIEPQQQVGEPGPYMRRRSPEDSRLDPEKTIADQFELLRVVDSARFPAFFDYRGHRYFVHVSIQSASSDH